ncbi:MAG: tRNA (adenosine(37)-N6)-dimethylallyltransferase MiaA [Verrucomicrobiota bacterium]|nr:tRNA (adenosine(37)-N6)-dimethylallyltransferase MiaA [Verrucomicrobiota bacterium]
MVDPIYIAGPTAAGKSSIAVEIAQTLGGEIVSVDSMQVYRRMDKGTAKPTTTERASVPHHLIDIIEPSEAFDAARFVERVEEVIKRNKRVILCGGTGLYFKALLEGLGEAPGANERLRAELEDMDSAALLGELEKKDQETFRKIDRQNRRRLVRAVEVIRLTGKPFSAQRAKWTGQARTNFFLLQRAPEDLRQRIDTRVDQMFADGLVGETEALLPDLQYNRTAQQALGYKQVIEHLRGERDLPATIALVKSRTWQFARRQQTWFRKMHGAIPVEVSPSENPTVTAQRILDLLQ